VSAAQSTTLERVDRAVDVLSGLFASGATPGPGRDSIRQTQLAPSSVPLKLACDSQETYPNGEETRISTIVRDDIAEIAGYVGQQLPDAEIRMGRQ
jgi:hypothetical protein